MNILDRICRDNQDNKEVLGQGYRIYKRCLIWKGNPWTERRLSLAEANTIIKEHGAWMLRNCYDFDCGEETNFWHVIKKVYDPNEYSKKVKKYIEKANSKFIIGIIPKELLLREGYSVLCAASKRYKEPSSNIITERDFKKGIEQAGEEYDFWGCVDRETSLLQAFSIVRKYDNWISFETSKANPAFLPKFYPMYGLYDARNKYYLQNKKYKYVDSGDRTVTKHSNIQEFLIEKLKFEKAYCRMRLYYAPWLSIAVKILYPFRSFPLLPNRVKNVLKFEEINRQQ